MKRILAIDPATKCGWAHSNGSCGVWDLSIRSDESNGMRLIRLEAKLRLVLEGPGIDLIVFEGMAVGSGPKSNFHTLKVQSQLQAVIERFCQATDGVECCSFHLSTIKKHAIPGPGKRRDKESMVAAAREKWPDVEIEDDNVADALWLLDLAMEEYGR